MKTLYGDMAITIEPGTNHGDQKKLMNHVRELVKQGAQKLPPNDKQFGHHYVHFKIKIPNRLNSTQKQAILKYAEVEETVPE